MFQDTARLCVSQWRTWKRLYETLAKSAGRQHDAGVSRYLFPVRRLRKTQQQGIFACQRVKQPTAWSRTVITSPRRGTTTRNATTSPAGREKIGRAACRESVAGRAGEGSVEEEGRGGGPG